MSVDKTEVDRIPYVEQFEMRRKSLFNRYDFEHLIEKEYSVNFYMMKCFSIFNKLFNLKV